MPRRKHPSPVNANSPAGKSTAANVLISIALAFHLVAITLSYSAIIEPSSTHSGLLGRLAVYLRPTHFAADGRPFYLAHATPDEQPHRLQIASGRDGALEIDNQTQWTTVEPAGSPGLAASDRYARWMTLAATLAEADRPSLAAALLMPLVAEDDSIDAVRIIRLPTQLTTTVQDAAPPVYLARVIRETSESGPASVRLVAVQSKRLTTYSRPDILADTSLPADNKDRSESATGASTE